MKTALYARYSTDKQRETSIEDQFRNCGSFAEREGWPEGCERYWAPTNLPRKCPEFGIPGFMQDR